jgi:ketosteroid isomerase-like protein
MGYYTPEEERNLQVVHKIFDPPPGFEFVSVIADDCVWWNALAELPGAKGVTEHRGKARVLQILTDAGTDYSDQGIDSYDMSTRSYHDVIEICDGDYVFRQQIYRAKTHGGQDYENTYGFLFRFSRDGTIERIWEHWDTLTARRVLFRNCP